MDILKNEKENMKQVLLRTHIECERHKKGKKYTKQVLLRMKKEKEHFTSDMKNEKEVLEYQHKRVVNILKNSLENEKEHTKQVLLRTDNSLKNEKEHTKQVLLRTDIRCDSDNSKCQSKRKVGLNRDEIKEFQRIMEVMTTLQKEALINAGGKKEDVEILVKSTFLPVGPPGVPPTNILLSSYPTKGEIQSTKTTNVCMQTCHQTMSGESNLMVDLWQMANDSSGTGMSSKDSLIKAFGQSGADQIGLLEKFLLSVKDKVNIGNLGALSDVHVSHTQNLIVPGSDNHLFIATVSWGIMVRLVFGFDERRAFIHVAFFIHKALALCSSSGLKEYDSQELCDLQQPALVSVKAALQNLLFPNK
jgi:hypothetical protein